MNPHQNVSPGFDLRAFKEDLRDQSFYVSQIKNLLPKKVFKPVPQRLGWFLLHYAIAIISVYAICKIEHLPSDLVFSLLLGHSLGVAFFIGHEIAHGSVIKNKSLIVILSTICFAHWGLYSKAWISWHNRKHHHVTQHPYKDPDCFGKKYLKDKMIRKIETGLPGNRSLISYTFLFWFFSFYSFYITWIQPRIFINEREKNESRIFFIIVYAVWVTASILLHAWGILWLFLLPALVSNFVIMSYISTNHFLNPLTEEVNDPMVNSLTVDTNKLFNIAHMNFSYHVEHHLFPYVSPKYAPLISKILKEKFPEKYNHMPHGRALKLLYQRPRFYHDDVTLVSMKTGEKYPTIIFDDLI